MTPLTSPSYDEHHKNNPESSHICGRHNTARPSPPEWRFPLDMDKKSQSLAVISQKAARKRIRHYPAFIEHVWNQLRFQSFTHRLIQGSLLLAAMLLALYLRRESSGGPEMITACTVFFVFAGNICLSETAHSFSWHMAELEQTLYLNLKQMICIRLLEAGIADLGILTLFLGITGSVNTLGIGTSLIYMLVPFLWSDILYLHMLAGLRSTAFGFRSTALGLLCGLMALFPAIWPLVYQPKYLIVWQVLAIAGILLLIAEGASLLEKIEQGELFSTIQF